MIDSILILSGLPNASPKQVVGLGFKYICLHNLYHFHYPHSTLCFVIFSKISIFGL